MFNSDQVRQFYNEYGEKEWNRLDSSAYGRLIYHGHVKFMEPCIGPGKRVLDAGCGAGRFSIPVAQSGSRVTLVDISDSQLALAKQKIDERGLINQVERYIRADVSSLDMIPDNYFDTVICYGAVLNYLFDNVRSAIDELKRVTRNEGMLLFSVNSLWGVLRSCAVNEGMIPEKFWGQPEYWKILDVAKTGDLEHPDVSHPPRHFYTASEFKKMLEESGVGEIETGASPSVMSGLRAQAELLEKNATAWKTMLDVEDLSRCVDNLVDAGEFLLMRGKVKKSKSDIEAVESTCNQNNDFIVETPRLILREFKKDDWKEVHMYSADEEVTRFMPWGPNTEEDTMAFVERALKEKDKIPRKEYHFVVIEKSSGCLIGAVEIAVGGYKDLNGMLGYCYSRKSWGRGIGTEIAGALIKYGFENLELHRIWADCDALNYRSQRVLEKNGMRREGFFKKKSFIKGEWRDDFHYAILREEWEAGRTKP